MPSSVVDLFCGVGGLTHGFVQEGFNVVAGIDVDSSCQFAYETNNGAEFIEQNVNQLTAAQLTALYPTNHTKILVGCAPCQPFSKYTNKRTADDDKEWELVRHFAELIREVRPEITSMENVPELQDHTVFQYFLETLSTAGYEHSWSIVNCVDYGVPQNRTRLVLFASRLGRIKIIPKTHSPQRHRTVAHAIRYLEPIAAGQVSPNDSLHRASALTELNLRRIRQTPEGGSWKDWPEELILECHKKQSGKSYGSIYGRMWWNRPAPTMTTQCNGLGNGRFGHPEQDRAISLREAALIQSFPRDYEMIETENNVNINALARQIGNAVPVRLGRIIARTIRRHLEQHQNAD